MHKVPAEFISRGARKEKRSTTGMLCRAWQIGVAAVAIQASAAFAQNFPTKPIRIVIPFTPGGALDTIGRLVSQNMTETLKQSVIVDYRAGAEGRASGKAR